MRVSKSWIIAAKDFKTYRKKRNIIYSLAVVPLIVAVLIPAVVSYGGHKGGANGIPATELMILLPAFLFFYVILAAYLPTPIASYTIVGEKVEKSLEPLLATPTTDGEILLGKGIAAFIPPLVAVWGGATVFMILMDITTHSTLGYYYFPNWDAAVLLFTLVPLASLYERRGERDRLFKDKRRQDRSTDWGSYDHALGRFVRRRGAEHHRPWLDNHFLGHRSCLPRGGRPPLLRLKGNVPQGGDTD